MSRKLFFAVLVSCLYLLSSNFVFAQGTTSRVTGTVTDNSGAVVSGAFVSLTNEGTGTTLTTQTSDNGVYSFDLIQPGTYQLAVERQGFKKFVSTKNSVFVNQPATINVSLEIGDVSAVVTVESSVEEIQTSTSGNVGSLIEERTLESLPIVGQRGRNPLSLLNYQPGIVNGGNTGGGVHVHGSRDRAFNFTLDGIDINESTAGGSNFTPLRPNPDSLQEFQIVTSNFTAELGRSSGAQVTLTTKSGTNKLSGNIFEFYQTPRFHANEWELNYLKQPKRQFVQHMFGGSVGGPIVIPGFGEGTPIVRVLRDRAFFFVNLQMLRTRESRLQSRTVYTESARSGIFRYVEGGRNANAITSPTGGTGPAVNADGSPRFPICAAGVPRPCIQSYNINNNSNTVGGVDTSITSLLAGIPTPNNFTGGDGLNTGVFNFVAPQTEKQYDFVSRFDVKITQNQHVYVRYAQGEQNSIGDISGNSGGQRFPGYPSWVDTYRTPKNLAINHRWSPNGVITNEFIFGLNKFGFSFEYPAANPDVPFVLNTVSDPDRNFAYNARSSRTYQFVDNMTFDFSPHIIKAGVNLRFGNQFDDRSSAGGQIEPQVGFGAGNSNFTGFNLPASGSTGINSNDLSLLRATINNFIGRIGSYSQGFVVDPANPSQFAPGGTRWNWTAYYPEYDFYIQDTWRARSNLVFDIGLRWELKPSPTSKDLPILAPNQQFTIGAAPTNSLRWEERELFKNDYNNLSPSIGFAWDPFKTGKTSVRANYRLSYDRFPSQVFANFVYQSAPGNTFAASVSGIDQQNLLLRNGLPNLTPTQTPDQLRQPPAFSTTSINVIDPDLRFAESHQWFAGVQREIGWKNVLEVNYIGRRGTHLFGAYNVNQVNIFAKDSRCSRNFLETYEQIRLNGSTNECLTNLLFTGDPNNSAGTTTFRGITAVSNTLNPTNLSYGSVAVAAQAVSQNTTSGAQTIGRATGFNNPFFFQPYPQFTGGLNVLDSNDISDYHGLEVILKKRLSSGFSYQLAYTLSKSMDSRSWDPTFATVSTGNAQSASSTPFDNNDRYANYSWSDFDRRHVLQGYYVWELPFGRERKFGSNIPRAVDWIVGGWQLAGTLLWSSGRPFTVYSGLNTVSNVVQATANCDGCTRNMGSLIERNGIPYFFTEEQAAKFSQPAPGEQGNLPRNFFVGPRQFQTDASLSKKFSFSERYSFDVRVDVQNLTNTPYFGFPNATISSGSAFGQIGNSVISFSRKVQFSGKFNF